MMPFWGGVEGNCKSLHDSVTMLTHDLYMLCGLCFLARIIVKLMLEKVILSNAPMMRK